jgi:hypothetical protein
MRNPKMTKGWGETVEGPRMLQWHKGPRPERVATRQNERGPKRKAVAIPEKEEGSHDWHQTLELKTAITSGKKGTGLQNPQEYLELEIMKQALGISSGLQRIRT